MALSTSCIHADCSLVCGASFCWQSLASVSFSAKVWSVEALFEEGCATIDPIDTPGCPGFLSPAIVAFVRLSSGIHALRRSLPHYYCIFYEKTFRVV